MGGTPLTKPVTKTINPGDEVEVRMKLMMMPGMDGPHLFQMTVPVKGPNGEDHPSLELYVKALFSGQGGEEHQQH